MYRVRGTLIAVALLFSVSAAAKMRAVQHPSATVAPRSVMWIAAHPDDEAVAAPLLAKWCREEGAQCTFVIVTRGDSGGCLLPQGCDPDISTVRASEAGAASQLFHANSILLTLPDGGGTSAPLWPATIVDTVAGFIEALRPQLILTFDPRHGTTCHPDHRAIAQIVLNAVKSLSYVPDVYLLETVVTFSADPFAIGFKPASADVERFDATQFLDSFGAPAWEAVSEDMARHASQFDERWIAAVRAVPPQDRAVYIAPAEAILQRTVVQCP